MIPTGGRSLFLPLQLQLQLRMASQFVAKLLFPFSNQVFISGGATEGEWGELNLFMPLHSKLKIPFRLASFPACLLFDNNSTLCFLYCLLRSASPTTYSAASAAAASSSSSLIVVFVFVLCYGAEWS